METKITHKYTAAQRDAKLKEARELDSPVLIAEWVEGWEGHEQDVKLWAMPDGTTQEKATPHK